MLTTENTKKLGLALAQQIYLQARWVRGKISVEGLYHKSKPFAISLKRSYRDPNDWGVEEIDHISTFNGKVEDQIAAVLANGMIDFVLYLGDAIMYPHNEITGALSREEGLDTFCGALYSVKGLVAHHASTLISCEQAYIEFDSPEDTEEDPERGFPESWSVVQGDPLHIPEGWSDQIVAAVEDDSWN
tara:strand:+ start:207 stop:770 length:564 start_codon:yes stop_codon:yes gene_type:complete